MRLRGKVGRKGEGREKVMQVESNRFRWHYVSDIWIRGETAKTSKVDRLSTFIMANHPFLPSFPNGMT